jgi:folate-binding protein YgfZ
MSVPQAEPVDRIAPHRPLVSGAGLVDLPQRTQVELLGADRASFLHNLCTNEIRKLAAGKGCEAFLTTVQGKTLAHGLIFAGPESLVIDTVPGQSEVILPHLDHYLVCEQVTLVDRTAEWSELLLAGAESEALLGRLTGVSTLTARLDNAQATLAGKSVWLRRADLVGRVGFLISASVGELPTVRAALVEAGAVPCGQDDFEAARIEWGFPLFGVDISDKNLPQEIGRDALAISFIKGCYLGQETVARIDALGHVNKTLVGVRFLGSDVPPPGAELFAAGEVVAGQAAGQITSVAYSPDLAAPLALAFVRRDTGGLGTRLSSAVGEAEVVALPVR